MSGSEKILGITGAFGYIGKRLIENLKTKKAFHRVVCLDIVEPAEKLPDHFIFRHCDVRDTETVVQTFQETRINTVVHLAFIAHPTRDPGFEHEVDITGTENILLACEKLKIQKLVVASSDCAYGFFKETPDYLTEAFPLRATPGFPYAENKVKIEQMVEEFGRRVPSCRVTIIRPCIVMGPNMKNALSETLRQSVIVSFTGYDPIMQFVHEDDVAEAFYLAATNHESGAFNLAADKGMRFSEMVKEMGKRHLRLPVWLVYPLVNTLYALRILAFGTAQLSYIRFPLSMNIEKIKNVLGFSPKYTSKQTLASFRDAER
ncbi:MAG: NAD-dependent epimerase/dehydratase family protein [Desulfobacterales bacterium]